MIDAIGDFLKTALELAIAWRQPATIEDLAETSRRDREKQTEGATADQ